MFDTPKTREPRKLCIWQQNINWSLEGQLDLLQSLKSNNYDIVALQEPYIDFLGWTRANLYWTVIYPRQHLINPNKTRSVILVNHNISMNNWEDVSLASNDVTGVWLHGPLRVICILNVYNDCKNNRSLKVVEEFMEGEIKGQRLEH